MSDKEQIYAFGDDLDKLVERYRSEFDITYASVVGVLFMKATLMTSEASEDSDDN
jgi:hypothetical protein